jgi:hypothetical protein
MTDDDLLVVLGVLEDEVRVYAIARELEVPRQEVSRDFFGEIAILARRCRPRRSA